MKEGIGLGYLEAMALGKVVVAYDLATHNEYIRDGVNGHLFTKQGPVSASWAPPGALAPALAESCHAARAKWLQDRQRIREFLTSV